VASPVKRSRCPGRRGALPQPGRLRHCRRNPLHATRLDVGDRERPQARSSPTAHLRHLPPYRSARSLWGQGNAGSREPIGVRVSADEKEQVAHRPAHVFARSNVLNSRLVQVLRRLPVPEFHAMRRPPDVIGSTRRSRRPGASDSMSATRPSAVVFLPMKPGGEYALPAGWLSALLTAKR
jgi:hypothetical protein